MQIVTESRKYFSFADVYQVIICCIHVLWKLIVYSSEYHVSEQLHETKVVSFPQFPSPFVVIKYYLLTVSIKRLKAFWLTVALQGLSLKGQSWECKIVCIDKSMNFWKFHTQNSNDSVVIMLVFVVKQGIWIFQSYFSFSSQTNS